MPSHCGVGCGYGAHWGAIATLYPALPLVGMDDRSLFASGPIPVSILTIR